MATKLSKYRGKTGVFYYKSTQKKFHGKPDTCFYITYKVDGRKRTEKIGWKSEGYSAEVAAELRAQKIKSARHGNVVKTQAEINKELRLHNKTIVELKDHYFNSDTGRKIKNPKPDLSRWQKYLAESIGGKRVPELSPIDIERIKRKMRGKAPATVKHVLVLLRRILNYGNKHHLCPPISFTIELPKINNEVTEYLTPEQAANLKRVLDEWPRQDIARMVKLAWLTGMRRGEIFKLQIEHIDFIQDIITLVDPKSGKNETIPMSPLVATLLTEQIEWTRKKYPESPYVFPGKNGGRRVDCSAVDRIKKAANLPKNFRPFHGLRHHFAVMLASSGEYTLDMIGELLTHKDTKITRRYSAYLPDAKKKAASRASEILMEQLGQAEIRYIEEQREKKAGDIL